MVGGHGNHRRDTGTVRDFSGEKSHAQTWPGTSDTPYCASYSRYSWGLKRYLVCAGDGMPIMWCLAHPKIGEREVVAALWSTTSI
jgi:hypothetical protein